MFSAAITILFALSNALRATSFQIKRSFAISFTPHRSHTTSPIIKPCHSHFATAYHTTTQVSTSFDNEERPTIISSQPPEVRNPLFRKTNAISRSMPVPHPEIWKQCFENTSRRNAAKGEWFSDLVAHNFLGRQHVIPNRIIVTDVEVTYDEPYVGAQSLLEKCGLLLSQVRCDGANSSSSTATNMNSNSDGQNTSRILAEIDMKEQQTLDHLTTILSYYQSIISPNDTKTPCRARIVSSLGSIGTKCPRWHADHVPVRLVMSLIGPGCEYIPYAMETIQDGQNTIQVVNRDALNNLEDDDTAKANEVIVPSHLLELAKQKYKTEIVTCAKEGEAVLLMGRGWQDRSDGVLAAVHRSPRLMNGEERILLTVDVAHWDNN